MVLPSRDDSHAGRSVVSGTWDDQEREFLPHRLIVRLAQPAQEGDARSMDEASALDHACADICHLLPEGRLLRRSASRRAVFDFKADADVAALAREVSARDDVEYAEPDTIDRAALVPNDPRYVDQWSPGVVGAEATWDLETGDPNTAVGIIDSGISMTGGTLDHGDLNDAGRFVLGTDFVDGGDPRDVNGHGTHVAGIAAAPGNNAVGMAGMNWGSPVYVCRTLDANGNGSSADFADAVEEITDWALANGVRAVINYSAGGADNQTKRDACQYASDNGMLVVAATGNDNAGPVIAPASYSTTITGVIAVGATDSADNVAGFSNVGPEVTVVAPGDDIFSTMPTYAVTIPAGPDYGTLDGTSMATPLVTGLCALMWSRHPTFTNAKIKQCLIDTAVKLGPGSFDNTWGFGRVDALAALKCGDVTIPPTIIGPGCGVTTRIRTCVQTLITRCVQPSRLPALCPTSRLVSDCVVSRFACPSLVRCPSWVDACPSALIGCEVPWRPGDLINPGDLVIRPGAGPLAGPLRPGAGPVVAGRIERVQDEATTGRAGEVWYDAGGRFWALAGDTGGE